jgi:hypothetical protein
VQVFQGGELVGTVNPATGRVDVPECPEGCTDPYTIKWDVEGTEITILVDADPCGGEAVLSCDTLIDAVVVEAAGINDANGVYLPQGGGYISTNLWTIQGESFVAWSIVSPDESAEYDATGGEHPWNGSPWTTTGDGDPPPTVRQATIGDLCPCPPPEPCGPLVVTVNGEVAAEVEEPCGETVEFIVVDRESNPVDVTLNRGSIVVSALPCEEPEPCPLGYTLQDSAENILLTGIINDPCEEPTLLLTAPDGSVRWDGQMLTSVRSNGQVDLDCDTLVNAAYAVDGGSVTGTYKPNGTLNGREVFRLDVSHNFEYNGTRWRLVKPGSDYDAAVGAETKPWTADWSATPVTVTQATIGNYCADCEPADLCALLALVEPENAQTQILDCVTEETEDAIAAILTTRAISAAWGAYDDETTPVILPAEYQGVTYAFVSDVGTNGTITVSVNNGASFAAPPFTVGASEVIFRRTTIGAQGSAIYEE